MRADGSTDPQEAYDAVVADLVDDAGLAPSVEVAEVGEPSEGGGPADGHRDLGVGVDRGCRRVALRDDRGA